MKASLVLEDGTVFVGESFGAEGESGGEVCFNTSMTGYQEILTDPSYSGQIVTMTYPEIGNYGVNNQDVESRDIQVSGFIVKNYCDTPSSWRCDPSEIITLDAYLKKKGVPGIQRIDTRKLVRILREKGALRGFIAPGEYPKEKLMEKVREVPSLVGKDLVETVSAKNSYEWKEGDHPIRYQPVAATDKKLRVVAMDFGIKYNILRRLRSLGLEVEVVPGRESAENIMAHKPDGILLSNGPGDPEPVGYAVDTIKSLLGKVPVFGICLGHQLLSLALGCQTYKLKFGHRGANHPIKNLLTGGVAISSQNHGFAVALESIPQDLVEVTHINLNDNTVAGLRHKILPAFSVQYHPEASPGPKDSEYLFQQFLDLMVQFKSEKS